MWAKFREWVGKAFITGREALTGLFFAPDASYVEPNFQNFATVGYGRNELVYACITEKATSLAESQIRVYGPDGLGDSREEHPLRQLLATPNPILSEFELYEMLVVHLDLAGSAFLEIVTDQAGRPTELWPLRPDMVRFLPGRGPKGELRYGFQTQHGVVDLGTNVVQFRYPNPVDPYVGMAPMRPALRAIALDNEATDYAKSLLQNKAMPGVIVTTQDKVDKELHERLSALWKMSFGGANRGNPAFLQKGMDAKVLGLSMDQLEFPDLRTISESRICMAFSVPPILVGAKVGLDRSTFANYGEARRSFWEETIMPLQKRLLSPIVRKLLPMTTNPFGDPTAKPRRVTVKWDNSEILALKDTESSKWDRAINALRAGGITVTDFRRMVGLPSLPGTDVFLMPAGVIPQEAPQPLLDPSMPVDEAAKRLGMELDEFAALFASQRGLDK